MKLSRKTIMQIIAVIVICAVAFTAGYVWHSVTVPLEVKEPLEVTDYPTSISLYAGENQTFSINITDHASVSYIVTLSFTLNDTGYQESYVTFSDLTYTINPGENTIEAWIAVSGDAPPANLELEIEFDRAAAS